MTREGLDASKQLFQEAIRLDPNYALAHDGLAYCWYSEGFLGFVAPKDAMPQRQDRRAPRHRTGRIGRRGARHTGRHPGAVRLGLGGRAARDDAIHRTERRIAFFARCLCVLLSASGRQNRGGGRQTQQALALDPLSILFRVHLAFLFYLQRNYEHSIAQFRKVLEMNPQYYLAHAMMGTVYTQTGRFDEALACYARAREADPDSKFVASFEAMTLAFSGKRAEAAKMLMRSRAAPPATTFHRSASLISAPRSATKTAPSRTSTARFSTAIRTFSDSRPIPSLTPCGRM